MKFDFLMRFGVILGVSPLLFSGCGGSGKGSLLELNPYENDLAFYGKVIDKETRESPLYPVTITLLPEDPGNHVVVDSSVFFISGKGLDPAYDYSLKVGAQYYQGTEVPLKFTRNKKQNLGLIEINNIEKEMPLDFTRKPFVEFSPGSGLLEKPGFSLSSFLDRWKAMGQPFSIEDVEQHIKTELPAGSPEITRAEVQSTIDGWLKDGLIQKYGQKTYIIK